MTIYVYIEQTINDLWQNRNSQIYIQTNNGNKYFENRRKKNPNDWNWEFHFYMSLYTKWTTGRKLILCVRGCVCNVRIYFKNKEAMNVSNLRNKHTRHQTFIYILFIDDDDDGDNWDDRIQEKQSSSSSSRHKRKNCNHDYEKWCDECSGKHLLNNNNYKQQQTQHLNNIKMKWYIRYSLHETKKKNYGQKFW